MFHQILGLLSGSAPPAARLDDLQLAVAVLLVQAACMDDHFDSAERAAIERLLADRFDLSPESTKQLLESAEIRAEQSSQLFPFTHKVLERLDADERVRVIEMLWEVAYADGVLTGDEDALVRRVAGLIYVSDRDRGEARKRVLRRMASRDSEAG